MPIGYSASPTRNPVSRSANILNARLSGGLTFLHCHLIFVGSQNGTCFMSLLWHLEFWDGSYLLYCCCKLNAFMWLTIQWRLINQITDPSKNKYFSIGYTCTTRNTRTQHTIMYTIQKNRCLQLILNLHTSRVDMCDCITKKPHIITGTTPTYVRLCHDVLSTLQELLNYCRYDH
jgi:hypothetical protein